MISIFMGITMGISMVNFGDIYRTSFYGMIKSTFRMGLSSSESGGSPIAGGSISGKMPIENG